MKIYLIRGGDKHHYRYTFTVPADELSAHYPIKHRDTGRTIGGLFREVEADGHDKERIELNSTGTTTEGNTRNAKGSRVPMRHFDVRWPDLKTHVRVLAEPDVTIITDFDAEIQRLQNAIQAMREMRDQHVKDSWRRARPANSLDLREMAETRLKDNEEAKARA